MNGQGAVHLNPRVGEAEAGTFCDFEASLGPSYRAHVYRQTDTQTLNGNRTVSGHSWVDSVAEWRGETHTSMSKRETKGSLRGPMTWKVTKTTAEALKDRNERRLETPTLMKEVERPYVGSTQRKALSTRDPGGGRGRIWA